MARDITAILLKGAISGLISFLTTEILFLSGIFNHKFMMPQPGKQIIAIHILSIISEKIKAIKQ